MIPAPGKKIYFISDFHLGAPDMQQSRFREDKIVSFLHSIEGDVDSLFILGDIFDFWFEYKKVVPKGFTRLLGKLAALTDKGIPIHVFTGNHDLWMRGYFEEELDENVPALYERKLVEVNLNGITYMAWMYWYSGDVTGKPIVASGDVLQYLQQKNH